MRTLISRIRLVNRGEAGTVTAEYAVMTIGAVAFASVLVLVLKGGAVRRALTDVILSAFSVSL
jgi:hypothetical protein